MRRAKIVLCAAVAAVLLVGILVPAVADKQTEPFSCKKTETYACVHTVTYACKETETYWCSKTRRVYRCHTAQVCTTKTERVCSWNPYLRTNVCRDVKKRVCQPERRCQWETETYRGRCTREVDATCTREVTGTCTREYTGTCTRPKSHTHRCTGEAGYITDTRTAAACVSAGGTHWAGAPGFGRVAYMCYNGSGKRATDYTAKAVCDQEWRKRSVIECDDSAKSDANSDAQCDWIERQEPLCICPLCAEAGITGKHNVRMAAAACPELLRCEFDGSTPISNALKSALDGIDEVFAGYEDASLGVKSPRACDSAKTVEQRRQDLVIFRAAIPTCGEQVDRTATCYGSAAPRSDLAAFKAWMVKQFGTTSPSVWCCTR